MKHQLPLKYIDAVARAGSIRKAAESLAITSTALNRRILSMEEDLGTPIFERLPQGVRLSVAGELLIHHIRSQLADMARVRSRIADLSGERRGHVAVLCSQSAVGGLLPPLVAAYRRDHPAVTFSLCSADNGAVEQRLEDHSVDLALVLGAQRSQNLQTVAHATQPVLMLCDREHPLSGRHTVRLSECLAYPVALPPPGNELRHLLERSARQRSHRLAVAVESDNPAVLLQSIGNGQMIGFQIPAGLQPAGPSPALLQVGVDERDVPPGQLSVVHWRGRTLPVAAARFMDRLVACLADSRQY